jgi:hypothetical protein
MPLGEFLFEYLHRCGVRHSFGIPGDFALPTFAWLEKSKIKSSSASDWKSPRVRGWKTPSPASHSNHA